MLQTTFWTTAGASIVASIVSLRQRREGNANLPASQELLAHSMDALGNEVLGQEVRGACVSLAEMLVFMTPLATHGNQSTLSWTSSSRSHLALGRPHLRDFSNTIPCTQTSHASTARQGGVPAACRCFVRLSSFKRLPGREEAWPARRCPRRSAGLGERRRGLLVAVLVALVAA